MGFEINFRMTEETDIFLQTWNLLLNGGSNYFRISFNLQATKFFLYIFFRFIGYFFVTFRDLVFKIWNDEIWAFKLYISNLQLKCNQLNSIPKCLSFNITFIKIRHKYAKHGNIYISFTRKDLTEYETQ